MSVHRPYLDVTLIATGMEPLLASTRSVFDAVAVSDGAAEAFRQFFADGADSSLAGAVEKFASDFRDLVRIEAVTGTADGALELVFDSSDRYTDLVTAIAGCGGVSCDGDLHKWPILSVCAGHDSLAEPTAGEEGAATPAREGAMS